ncbi:hypothetical protein Bca52824_026213 [Brassica carinata]|uniref:Uncharacterized protein n=1 Tax=Brassica carinata TaxID=52824 RepID=A0A8X7V7P4_BRACI|nr:hypothetical protein Bca52824_026213 [Brassica carinata]
MRQLHAVYGEWLLKDGCWNFVVDRFKGARMLVLSEGLTHVDLVAMAQENYNLDMNTSRSAVNPRDSTDGSGPSSYPCYK